MGIFSELFGEVAPTAAGTHDGSKGNEPCPPTEGVIDFRSKEEIDSSVDQYHKAYDSATLKRIADK